MIPASWRDQNLREGGIYLVKFYKRNRINFDCIEDCIEAIIYPWTGGYGQSAQKVLYAKVLYATEIKTKELKIHAEGLLPREVYDLS